MNEEEKKTIEDINGLITIFETDNGKDFEATCLAQKEIALNLKTILNLIEKLQKENELAKKQVEYDKTHIFTPQTIKLNYIPVQIVKDNIEKEIKYHERNILEIENITMLKSKTAKEEAEIEFNKYAIVVLKKILQELIEGEN